MADHPSSSCSGSYVAESKRSQCHPKQHRHQELAASAADGGRSATCGVPSLQGRELPGRRSDPAPWSRRPRKAGVRSARARRGCSGRCPDGATLSLRVLRSHPPCRGSRSAPATAVQRGGDRLGARALGAGVGDRARGAASSKPGEGARHYGDDRLGDVATVGEGGEAARPLPLDAVRCALGDAARRSGARGDGARGERGSDHAALAARAPRLLRRRAGGVRGRWWARPKTSAHLNGSLPRIRAIGDKGPAPNRRKEEP